MPTRWRDAVLGGKAALARWLRRADRSFPETKPANVIGRMRSLERRRAKNKVARASRKRNR